LIGKGQSERIKEEKGNERNMVSSGDRARRVGIGMEEENT